jgi:hypothetical protein
MLPLTQEAFTELESLQDLLQTVSFDESVKDKWTLVWGSNTYSSSRLYKASFPRPGHSPYFCMGMEVGVGAPFYAPFYAQHPILRPTIVFANQPSSSSSQRALVRFCRRH